MSDETTIASAPDPSGSRPNGTSRNGAGGPLPPDRRVPGAPEASVRLEIGAAPGQAAPPAPGTARPTDTVAVTGTSRQPAAPAAAGAPSESAGPVDATSSAAAPGPTRTADATAAPAAARPGFGVGAAAAQPASVVAAPPPARRASLVRRAILLLVLATAIGGGATVGYRWWQDSLLYVSTDNAQIAGRLVQVGSLAAGRVAEVRFDVGQRVARDQVVARLYVPVPVGSTSNGQPKLEFRQTEDAQVEVIAPVDGMVIARAANPGDTVPAGQPLLTLVDPRQLWINANVEETSIRRVQRGQPVTVHIDALDIDLPGRVSAITPASAGTFSLLPSQNTSGNFTKQTQLVPVKIELERPEPRLSIGTSASVRIRVQP